jgi:DNA-binding NarL/FixJ family response regulator
VRSCNLPASLALNEDLLERFDFEAVVVLAFNSPNPAMLQEGAVSHRFLLVDDHAMFRAGLRSLLKSLYPDAEFRETGDGTGALIGVQEFKPDLMLLDLHLPDQSGLQVARQVLAGSARIKIIVLSGESELSYVQEALKTGVSAYLMKTSASEELPRAISAVLEGRLYLCPETSAVVLQDYHANLSSAPPKFPRLSMREQEVLVLIAEGLRTKEIASRLELGTKTVETYRRRLMLKLACGSTAELVRYAMREGLIKP